jgi:hypothetical protein
MVMHIMITYGGGESSGGAGEGEDSGGLGKHRCWKLELKHSQNLQ